MRHTHPTACRTRKARVLLPVLVFCLALLPAMAQEHVAPVAAEPVPTPQAHAAPAPAQPAAKPQAHAAPAAAEVAAAEPAHSAAANVEPAAKPQGQAAPAPAPAAAAPQAHTTPVAAEPVAATPAHVVPISTGPAPVAVAQEQTAPVAAEPSVIAEAAAAQFQTPEYVVGETDVLRINVWKEPEVSQPSITVRPDGMISLPLLGVVRVTGMTPTEIQQMLAAKLTRFMNKPQVTVSVLDIRSKQIYITGEVVRPGAYPLIAPTDILQMIVRAGGLTPFAHRRSVRVLRVVDGKQQRYEVNYARLLRGEHMEQNIVLQPGDTVVVP
jgi:polysaccharide export outer membrane protein